MEDLGQPAGPDTAGILNGQNPEAAERVLLEHVALLARLHGSTLGRVQEFRRMRAELGGPAPRLELFTDQWSDARCAPTPRTEIDHAISRYRSVIRSLGVQSRDDLDAEIEQVVRSVEDDPGPFLGFCKGDQHLGGDYLRQGNGSLRLYDFDAAGFRHVLLEGMPGRMTWGCYGHIPAPIVARMGAEYRAVLSRYCSEASDATVFSRALASVGARWHVLHVIHRIPAALERDAPQGPTTRRRLRLAWLDAFVTLGEETGHYPALTGSAQRLAEVLRAEWGLPGRAQPSYPAFAGTG